MLKRLRDLVSELVIQPSKKNVTLVMLASGVLCIVIGNLLSSPLELSFRDIGDVLAKVGASILGAGVFVAIMNSSQLGDIFERHIGNVFYAPDQHFDFLTLKAKWRMLTKSIFSSVLPADFKAAEKAVEGLLFAGDIHYHFVEFDIWYDIRVDTGTGIVTIHNTLTAKVYVTPNQADPCLEQKMNVGGNCRWIRVSLDEKAQPLEGLVVEDKDQQNTRILRIKLNDVVGERGSERPVRFERIIETTQKLSEEPFLHANISRYIKGARVHAKISEGFTLYFSRSGVHDVLQPEGVQLGTGFTRWVMAQPEQILLPGAAYTIMFLPDSGVLQPTSSPNGSKA